MTTPEGRIKARINQVLGKHKVWYLMPVPSGFQSKTIDYVCCHKGWFIAIEAKADGEPATQRQDYIMREIQQRGGLTFVVNSTATLNALDDALGNLNERNG